MDRPIETPIGTPIESLGSSQENIYESFLSEKQEAPHRIHDSAVQEIGQEGMAYANLSLSDSLPTYSGVGSDKAAISFVTFQGSDEGGGHFSDSIRLPLANTVFQTGSPTMMTHSIWGIAPDSTDFTLKEKRNISHHGIRLQLDDSDRAPALSVPLVPLSQPRKIEASMGNILRRVTGSNGASITASQELEEQVPRYFSARGEPSQATTVWALVTGPNQQNLPDGNDLAEHLVQGQNEEKQWESLWKQSSPSPLVPVALTHGARLHRVLSGGGGWGKKAGLLSLDPIPTSIVDFADGPNKRETSVGGSGEDFDADFDGEGPDLDSALQQVAKPGDWIQFFISPSTSTDSGTIGQSHDYKWAKGLRLGTIPSTTDAMPVFPEETEKAGSNEITVYPGTFGALAEGGMVISRRFKLAQGDEFSTVGTSTVDVPFSRYLVNDWNRYHDSIDEAVVGSLEK